MPSGKIGPHLEFFLKKKISIFLSKNVIIKGTLIGYDQFMNLAIEEGVFFMNKTGEDIGITLIRGNEIFAIELQNTSIDYLIK